MLPRINGKGRVAAVEILMATAAVRNLIREGKTHQLISVIQSGNKFGMQSMDMILLSLYRQGIVSYDEAAMRSADADAFARLTKTG